MQLDVAVIGAGAAGLAAGIFAGEAACERGQPLRLAVFDGARKPGAKILVSGGSRCNVTNETVTETDYFGGPRTLIRRVLKRFNHTHTLRWMRELGVELKLEDTGKYFPVTDNSRTVLDALLKRLEEVGAVLHAGARVVELLPPRQPEESWRLHLDGAEPVTARRVILATGGLALPKSGSDGWGLEVMRRLGHTVVPTTPALVPLRLDPAQPGVGGRFAEFSGVTLEVRLGLYTQAGKRLEERPGSLVFTHFGISGPAALDLSRHWLRAKRHEPHATFPVKLGVPELSTFEAAHGWLLEQGEAHPKRDVATSLKAHLPERLARAYAEVAGADTFVALRKPVRKRLAHDLVGLPLAVCGDRGYAHAEVTAGGVDLREVDMRSMASKRLDNLYLVGEILDVDGRLGGFNFTWSWATGHIAGHAVVAAAAEERA